MEHVVTFIGTGEIAHLHAEALLPLGWAVAGGYDIVSGAVEAFCQKWGGVPFISVEALLQDPRVDTVYICTRHDSHARLAALACAAKKNVFLEKPAAMSRLQAEEILQARRESPAAFTVGYNMRVTPTTTRFCDLLQEHGAQVESFRASMTGPPFMDGWASDPVQGGGVLVCQGSHMFDLLGYTLGSPVASVCAATQHLGIAQDRAPNAATILVELKNGVRGTLLLHDRGTLAFHAGQDGRMVNLCVYSPQGTFDMDAYGKIRFGTGIGYFEEFPTRRMAQCEAWGYAAQAKEFTRLIRTGKSRLCTLQQAAYTAAVVDAAKISAQRAAWQDVEIK